MDGSFGKDLFYGTFGEALMDLLGDMASRRVFAFARDLQNGSP